MKNFFLVFYTAIVLVLVGAVNVNTQEVLPEENLLTLACDRIAVQAEIEGVQLKNCRRSAPDEVDGRHAIIHVRVTVLGSQFQPVTFTVFFSKTNWAQQGIMVNQ